MKPKKLLPHLSDLLFIGLFVYLLIFPQYASEPTRSALEFCAKTLIPSLFIYTVLAKIIISTFLVQKATVRFGLAPIALIIGTLCGCPVGAKIAVTLYDRNQIDKRYAEYLCSFTNNASTSFILGFVGNKLYGDVFIGVRLLVYQIISSIIAAAVMKKVIYGKERLPKVCAAFTKKCTLRESIADGAATMIGIASCAVFFIVLSDAISHIFNFSDSALAILKSVLEFSSGCAEAAKLDSFALPITAFALGHCGLSVAMQVRSVVSGKLSFKPYILGKIISCTAMTLLAVIFG